MAGAVEALLDLSSVSRYRAPRAPTLARHTPDTIRFERTAREDYGESSPRGQGFPGNLDAASFRRVVVWNTRNLS